MRLLLTNDDGIDARGIRALAAELAKKHDVVIVAPDTQRSGNSHKITLRQELHVHETRVHGLDCPCYLTDGTPADCVRLGMYWLESAPFDAVITGINQGSNLGTDVLYSGTVGASTEAVMQGLPALGGVPCQLARGTSRYGGAVRRARDLKRHFVGASRRHFAQFECSVRDAGRTSRHQVDVSRRQ